MEKVTSFSGLESARIQAIWSAIRKDWWWIIGAALVCTALGGVYGKMNTHSDSTAQLVMAGLPFREAPDEADAIARMFGKATDIPTAILLCTSDETYKNTFDALSKEGTLEDPLKTLDSLRRVLKYEIKVAKETPYDILYSPIIRLTASAASPKDASTIVNTWAVECEKASLQYQSAFQEPSKQAFAEQLDQVSDTYLKAQEELAAFEKEHIIESYAARITKMIETIAELESSRSEIMTKINLAEAQIASLESVLVEETPKLKLDWTVSDDLAALLGKSAPRRSAEPTEAAIAPQPLLEIELLNQNYMELRQNLALARVELPSQQALLAKLDAVIESRKTELTELQAALSDAKVQHDRLISQNTILGDAYSNLNGKVEFAEIAEQLAAAPQLQLLTFGAEWPTPRFRPAILTGFACGMMAFLAALIFSFALRMVLLPALRQ